MADLGPGTMPRGKYPESPAPAGSHALISRTPTPGGMLHANLGLPRPPPRNFQPPLPQGCERIPQPPNSSCCRSRGGMRGWPLLRPTHAPATTLKTNGNSIRHKTKKSKPLVLPLPRRHARLAGPPANTCSRNNPQNKQQQRPQNKKSKPLVPSSPEAARSPETNPLVPSSPEGVKESPPDTGATSKKKTKTNPLACPAAGRGAIHSEAARRRMTTPVVNTPPDTGATSKKKTTSSFRNFPRG